MSSPSKLLQIAFSPFVRSRDVARAECVPASWVASVNGLVCRALLLSQNQALSSAAVSFRGLPGKKVFACSLMFDETTERLALPVNDTVLPQQRSSAWHVLVSRQQFRWSVPWLGSQRQLLSWDCLRPAVPIVSTDAESIFDGLFCVPVAQPLAKCLDVCVGAADVSFMHMDRDGATSNDRVVGAVMASNTKSLVSHQTCGNHNNSLVEAAVVVAVRAELLPRLACVSNLLQMGGHFMKMITSTAKFVHLKLPRVIGPT